MTWIYGCHENSQPPIHLFLQKHGKEITGERYVSELGPLKDELDDKGSSSKVYQINDLGAIDVIEWNYDPRVTPVVIQLHQRFDLNICSCYWNGIELQTYHFADILKKEMHRNKKQYTGPTKQEERITKYQDRGYTYGEDRNLRKF